MKYQFFVVPACNPGSNQDELNHFCSSRNIVAIDKNFVADGASSFWTFCLSYLESSPPDRNVQKERVDYREVLSETEFTLFAKLRSLRKEMAEKDGVPPYALFTNEQLAEMVRGKTRSLEQLGKIPGIGKNRLEKYGQPFLDRTPCRTESWMVMRHNQERDYLLEL